MISIMCWIYFFSKPLSFTYSLVGITIANLHWPLRSSDYAVITFTSNSHISLFTQFTFLKTPLSSK